MVSLFIKNGRLNIQDDSKNIFEWNHSSFFKLTLGFEEDISQNLYFYIQKNEFQNAIKDIVGYLKEEGIAFTTDKQVGDVLSSIQKQEAEFGDVKQNLKNDVAVGLISLKRQLKEYQIDGLEHLLKVKNGANFSVPGSGKTTMVYAYYNSLKQAGIVDKIFVVGPFSCFSPWEEESEKCFDRKLISTRLLGSVSRREREVLYSQSKDTELFLSTYQTVVNDLADLIELCSKNKILLVVDESHKIKSLDGAQSTSLVTLAPYATRRVVLSGTPMPNSYLDLWSQFTFLWPGKQLLGEKNAFRARCDNDNEKENIKKEIRPFFYRVKKVDLGLPTPNTLKTEYSLKPIQAQIYHALSVRLISELQLQPDDKARLRQWRKAKMVRLLQAASNPTLLCQYSKEFEVPPYATDGTSLVELIEKYSQFEVPAKFDVAVNLTRKLLSEGKKVLLWTTFIHNIEMLKNIFADVSPFTIHGSIPRDDKEDIDFNREKEIRNFKSTQQAALLIANPAACAESISLHKICHDAIYLDRTFNCGQYIQSLDRIHRIGLDKDEEVNYHILIAKSTIDETIDTRLDDKYETMRGVLEDDIPIGDLEVEGPELEADDEQTADFNATVKDVQKFLKTKKN